jgi:hypothetical protein
MENLAKQLILVAQSILKLGNSQGKTLKWLIITYIGVRVRGVPKRFAHKAQTGEVAFVALDLLILLWARGVFTWEVKVTQGSTRSGHDLLELLLVVSEVILLLVVAFVAISVPVGVVVLVGGVKLLPLVTVNDEVGGVATLKAALGWSPPLLVELMQGVKLPCQQGNLVIRDALVLLIRSCSQRRWDSVGGVSIMTTNTSNSNQSFISKRSIMVRTTFPR